MIQVSNVSRISSLGFRICRLLPATAAGNLNLRFSIQLFRYHIDGTVARQVKSGRCGGFRRPLTDADKPLSDMNLQPATAF